MSQRRWCTLLRAHAYPQECVGGTMFRCTRDIMHPKPGQIQAGYHVAYNYIQCLNSVHHVVSKDVRLAAGSAEMTCLEKKDRVAAHTTLCLWSVEQAVAVKVPDGCKLAQINGRCMTANEWLIAHGEGTHKELDKLENQKKVHAMFLLHLCQAVRSPALL
eukprot:1157650-Pelagomonas_calceolata.AAC.2